MLPGSWPPSPRGLPALAPLLKSPPVGDDFHVSLPIALVSLQKTSRKQTSGSADVPNMEIKSLKCKK